MRSMVLILHFLEFSEIAFRDTICFNVKFTLEMSAHANGCNIIGKLYEKIKMQHNLVFLNKIITKV